MLSLQVRQHAKQHLNGCGQLMLQISTISRLANYGCFTLVPAVKSLMNYQSSMSFFIQVSFAFPACNIFIAIKRHETSDHFWHLFVKWTKQSRPNAITLPHQPQSETNGCEPVSVARHTARGPQLVSKPPAGDPQKRSNMISSVRNTSLLCPRNCEIHLTIRIGLYGMSKHCRSVAFKQLWKDNTFPVWEIS